jgi:general secretion pathway protein G
MHTNHPRHHRAHTLPFAAFSRGFTLLEMVIVLGIIAVLLGGAISLLKGIPRAAERQRVDADFNAIDSALRTYKINAGNYPTNSQGLQALVATPDKTSKWVQIMDKIPTDPWGTAYSYKFPGTKKPGEFELISAGPDQQPGTADDLSSQEK